MNHYSPNVLFVCVLLCIQKNTYTSNIQAIKKISLDAKNAAQRGDSEEAQALLDKIPTHYRSQRNQIEKIMQEKKVASMQNNIIETYLNRAHSLKVKIELGKEPLDDLAAELAETQQAFRRAPKNILQDGPHIKKVYDALTKAHIALHAKEKEIVRTITQKNYAPTTIK